MKCSECTAKKCKKKHKNRHNCVGRKERINCSCSCKNSLTTEVIEKSTSIVSGVAAVSGGVFLSVVSGGLAAAISGSVLIGAGSSLVFHPIQKTIKGERLIAKDFIKDLAIGTTIGAVTGPIGYGGSVLQQGISNAGKILIIRAATGATAGAVSGTIAGLAEENRTFGSVLTLATTGAVLGTISGGASHGASTLSSKVKSQVAKVATKVAVPGVVSATTDVTVQLIQNGEIDLKRTAINTTASASLGIVYETTSINARRTNIYADNKNKILIEKNVKNLNERKNLREIMKNANREVSMEGISKDKVVGLDLKGGKVFVQKVNDKLYFAGKASDIKVGNLDKKVHDSVKSPYGGSKSKKPSKVFKKIEDEEFVEFNEVQSYPKLFLMGNKF